MIKKNVKILNLYFLDYQRISEKIIYNYQIVSFLNINKKSTLKLLCSTKLSGNVALLSSTISPQLLTVYYISQLTY